MKPTIATKLMIHLMIKLSLISVVKLEQICDTNNCEGIYKLTMPNEDDYQISMSETKLMLTYIQSPQEVTYVKRERLSIYCYDGTSIDPNTGCYENLYLKNPTCTELKRWNKEDICPTGWECAPDGDCWGYEAYKCQDDTVRYPKGPTNIKYKGQRWMVFPHHSCVSSWSCIRNKVKVEVQAEKVGNDIKYFYYTNDHDKIQIDTNLYKTGFNTKFNYTHCLSRPTHQQIQTTVDATCYSNSIDNIVCVTKSIGDNIDGVNIRIGQDLEGILRNFHVRVVGPLYTVKDGKIVNVGVTNTTKNKEWERLASELSRSASIEDVIELSTGLASSQLQTLYNVNQLRDSILRLQQILQTIFKYVSKIDGKIINEIVKSESKHAMKWISPNTFEICPCIVPEIPQYSNCGEEYKYYKGAYIKRKDSDECFNYQDRELKNITLYSPIVLSENIIKFLEPSTAASDSDIWDDIVSKRTEDEETDKESHSYDDMNDKIHKFFENIFEGPKKWFIYVTILISWITFTMVICGCISGFSRRRVV